MAKDETKDDNDLKIEFEKGSQTSTTICESKPYEKMTTEIKEESDKSQEDQDEISIQTFKVTRENWQQEESKPPWWRMSRTEAAKKAKELLDEKMKKQKREAEVRETERPEARVKVLSNRIQVPVEKGEIPKEEEGSSYSSCSDSEEEDNPPIKGKETPNNKKNTRTRKRNTTRARK